MKILLAVDGSEYSDLASRFLTCLNLSPGDEITVCHVIFWHPLYYAEAYYYETLREVKKEVAAKILDAALAILNPVKARVSTAVSEGPPEQCIMEAAASSHADLIVMGARGIKGIKSLFLGSVTRSVAHKATKPVLVIKPAACAPAAGFKILFATDGSDHAVDTGKLLARLPFPDNAEIIILHVIAAPFDLHIPESFHPGIHERVVEVETRAREREFNNSERVLGQAREYLAKRFSNVDAFSEVGDPSSEILRVAESAGSHIIAVGCRGMRGLKGLMGSVSRNVLTHARCSVLIGKTCND